VMKNRLVFSILFLALFFVSCGVKGLYKHTICNIGPSCFAYEFCNDGLFRYKFYHETLGTGVLQGTWIQSGDTLILSVDKRNNEFISCIKTFTNPSQENCRIKTFIISPLSDTVSYCGFIKVNELDWKQTDVMGNLSVQVDSIQSIRIKNEGNQVKDTVFIIHNTKVNYIEIYLAPKNQLQEIEEQMTNKFIRKGLKLYPVIDGKAGGDLQQKIYYNKIRWGCHYFQ
jgi:hypothetical protein